MPLSLTLDLKRSLPFLESHEQESAFNQSIESFRLIREAKGAGSEWLGWRTMLENPDDALLSDVENTAASVRADADIFIVCGIGGSYLGAKAVIEMFKNPFDGDKPQILYAGHHLSGAYLEGLVRYLGEPRSDGKPKKVYLNVISKSGTTTETALAFRIIRNWMYETYGVEQARKQILCTTSAEGGALNKVIAEEGYKKFVLPDDVGGRYSVLTPVGLLPIAVAGIDILQLFYGAVEAFRYFEADPEMVLHYSSQRTAHYKKGKRIEALVSFEPHLSFFGAWFQQLFGESEGKQGKGLFPITLSYSTDLHSLGQMVQQGERNLFETFIRIKKSSTKLTIPPDKDAPDGLDYLAGKNFHWVNAKALEGTAQAHFDGEVPVMELQLEQLSEAVVGQLIYFFELSCALSVYNLGLNPFDQPGVEFYKRNMFRLLGKPE